MSNSGKTWNRWRADREWFAVTTAFVVSARLGTMVSGVVAAMRMRLLECAAMRALCSGTPVFAVELVPEASAILVRVAVGSALETLR